MAGCCSRDQSVNIEAETIFRPLEQTAEVDVIDSRISDLDFITISDDERSYIADIVKMLTDTNGDLYISDTNGNLTVLDSNGAFKAKISDRGRAANEYTSISDIAISDDEILILDGMKVKCYDKTTTNWTRTVDIPIKAPCDAIAPDTDGGIFVYSAFPSTCSDIDTTTDFLLYGIDRNGAITERLIPRDDNTISLYNISQSCRNTYYLRPQNNQHVFHKLSDGEAIPVYGFDFGSENIPSGYFYDMANEDLEAYIKSDYYKLPMELHETDTHLFIRVAGPSAKDVNIVYDKQSAKGVRWQNLTNDMTLRISASDGEWFYAIFPELQVEDDCDHGPLHRYITNELKKYDPKYLQKSIIVKIKFRKIL